MFARKPVVTSLGASLAIQFTNVVTGILLARSLGVHGRGELAAVLLWPTMLAAVGSLGINEATTYLTARRREAIGTVIGTAMAIAVAEAVILIAVGLVVIPRVLSGYGASSVHVSQLFLAFIPLNIATLVCLGVLGGLQRFGSMQVVRLSPVAAALVALVVLATGKDLSVGNAAVVYIAANVATLFVAGWLLVRAVGRLRIVPDRGVTRELLAFGARSHLGNVSSAFNVRLDQLLISALLTPTKLGVYVVAVTLGSATSLVGSSVAVIAMPRAANATPNDRPQLSRHLLMQVTVCASVVTVPILIFTPQLLRLLFGAEYVGGATVARILLVGSVVLSTGRVAGSLLTGFGRPLDQGVGELLALGVTVVALALLLPRFELVGAAIASLLAYSVSFGWMILRLRRRMSEVPLESRDGVHGGSLPRNAVPKTSPAGL